MQPLCKIKMIYFDMPNFIFSQSSPLSAANSLEGFSLLGEVQNDDYSSPLFAANSLESCSLLGEVQNDDYSFNAE